MVGCWSSRQLGKADELQSAVACSEPDDSHHLIEKADHFGWGCLLRFAVESVLLSARVEA